MTLTADQVRRFARQILLPPIGGPGQIRIGAATVLLHGDAPLLATYLAAGGLGRLLHTGPAPEIAAHEPTFCLESAEPGAPSDLVIDLADGAAFKAATGPALFGAVGPDGRVRLGSVALSESNRSIDPNVASQPPFALLQTLAAGEALRVLAGGEAHSYEYAV
ncbi:MAG: hypothetical protein V3T86_01995 [Planctomycetota bacterium]